MPPPRAWSSVSSTVTWVLLAPVTGPCAVRAAVATSITVGGKQVPRSQLSGHQESPIVSGRYRCHGSASAGFLKRSTRIGGVGHGLKARVVPIPRAGLVY